MNTCIVFIYSCTFDQFKELVDKSMEETKAFSSEYELGKETDHKSIMLENVLDIEELEAFISRPEMPEWDKAKNCVDHVYSMERVN